MAGPKIGVVEALQSSLGPDWRLSSPSLTAATHSSSLEDLLELMLLLVLPLLRLLAPLLPQRLMSVLPLTMLLWVSASALIAPTLLLNKAGADLA